MAAQAPWAANRLAATTSETLLGNATICPPQYMHLLGALNDTHTVFIRID